MVPAVLQSFSSLTLYKVDTHALKRTPRVGLRRSSVIFFDFLCTGADTSPKRTPRVKDLKILLVEFGILGFGIRNTTNDWNQESMGQVG